MEGLKLSPTFVEEHLSLSIQDEIVNLSQSLSKSGFADDIEVNAMIGLACIHKLGIEFLRRPTGPSQLINALDPHHRNVVLKLAEELQTASNLGEAHFAALCQTFNLVSLEPTNQKFNNPQSSHLIEPSINRFKPLKLYQADLADKIYDHLNLSRHSKCVLQMPTGTGKTRTSIDIACKLFNQSEQPIQVLWLCNTEELAAQALQTFVETYNHIALKPVTAANLMATRDILDPSTSHFLICSIQSIASHSIVDSKDKLEKRGIDLAKLALTILDEAHITLAPTYEKALDAITLSGVPLLGLTATPGRATHVENATANYAFADYYDNNIFSLTSEGANPIEQLVENRVLSQSFFHPIEGATVNAILTPAELDKMKESRKIPKKIINLLSHDTDRNAIIISMLIHLLSDEKKIIYFGTSVEQSKLISTMLLAYGYSSAHVDGNSGKYRESIIKSFKRNEIQCLCNFGVLSTGFDDPNTNVVFIGRVTNSIVLYSQMVGRGLRGPLLGGTERCDIYTVMDNITDLPENSEIYNYFSGYFDPSSSN